MLSALNIYERPEGQRFWVVRCHGGRYYDHFVEGSLIGISHLDLLGLDETGKNTYNLDIDKLREKLSKAYKKSSYSTTRLTSHINQVSTFIKEINIGDIVMTIGHSEIKIGRIVGNPIINRKKIEVISDPQAGQGEIMFADLRRKVCWGPGVNRDILPYGLLRSLRANQAVFNIDTHWEYVYHLIYPFFRYKDSVYFTTNIKQKQSIDGFSVGQFFKLISELEIITGALEESGINIDYLKNNYNSIVEDYILHNKLSLTAKGQFASEGSAYFKLSKKTIRNLTIFYMLYSAIFGSTKLGWDGVVDLKTREKIYQFLGEKFKQNHVDLLRERLQLGVPEYNTKSLEDDSHDNDNAIEPKVIKI